MPWVTNAFRRGPVSRPGSSWEIEYSGTRSPMPFGVGRFPDASLIWSTLSNVVLTSPMPFGVGRFPDRANRVCGFHASVRVTNAFRRGPFSRPPIRRKSSISADHRHQCLSAWAVFPTIKQVPPPVCGSGYVTNAFRRGPVSRRRSSFFYIRSGGHLSPMPFGVGRFPDWPSKRETASWS